VYEFGLGKVAFKVTERNIWSGADAFTPAHHAQIKREAAEWAAANPGFNVEELHPDIRDRARRDYQPARKRRAKWRQGTDQLTRQRIIRLPEFRPTKRETGMVHVPDRGFTREAVGGRLPPETGSIRAPSPVESRSAAKAAAGTAVGEGGHFSRHGLKYGLGAAALGLGALAYNRRKKNRR
jgi:hypothetical protein